MSPLTHPTETKDLINRLRHILSSIHLDCECRTSLDGALDRFSNLECRRRLRNALAEARRQRNWIADQLNFLAELDQVTEREADATVFEEMAILFDEIGEASARAANAIRSIELFSGREWLSYTPTP